MIRKDNGAVQLDSHVAETLLREMTTGKYRDVDRLPPELTVAEEIGVSKLLTSVLDPTGSAVSI